MGTTKPGKRGRPPLKSSEEPNRAVPFSLTLPSWAAEILKQSKDEARKVLVKLASRMKGGKGQ